ncbi:GFA family protein [Allorhizobium sp. BGMRC 0089]|uniref:GFA family protein n=1 Tax=Allorhizobium sonneratiae TaxID=2934936 RepID=UPI00203339F3|nr:GFA family protein [Allorhizobium sonneratiae]MCM2291007.1 GFA family protein [Allorhizobium sonneratiae]
MTETRPQHNAACHCGAVKFRVRLSDELNTARRCTCSYCRMRGAVAVSASLSDIEFIEGEDNLTLYQFNTGTAKHYFCKTCGIYTHHQRRSNPQQFGINLACIEGKSPFDLTEIKVMDGVSHPNDTGGTSRVAGILRFEPAN